MSIQGSINAMLGSVGAAGFAFHQKRAAESLRQHEMEMLKVRTAAREKISRREASLERKKLKMKEQKQAGMTPEAELAAMGINPNVIENLKKKGTI